MKRLCATLSLLLAVVVGIYGCNPETSVSSIAEDQQIAHDLLTQVYTGSLTSLEEILDTPFLRGNNDKMMSKASAALREQFGEFTALELESVEPGIMKSSTSQWKVTAEKGIFEMKITFDANDKVVGLWFWSTTLDDWIPSHIFGLDNEMIEHYIKGN